ncbi:conserved hypothetical protein [Chthoniobacter flavus Ellin428]|uniref:SPOR domain-containing protein n=1 Tax=Chthoniobacter flavus Ellin428 TaxID=497964 RepID=B4D2M7_9BACT|nr:hypothetical protein [Chthoniobacter flavus]EDY19467.1 conserved hypothetical protein [Chthoniobacter flavus Ellin428]TCO90407.1 hypothetical protein EV701_11030 [Chthoniobacter flavus]
MNVNTSTPQPASDNALRDAGTWAVWRQDDSGSRFLIEANLTEARARSVVAEFEARGHKQTYWCHDEKVSQ